MLSVWEALLWHRQDWQGAQKKSQIWEHVIAQHSHDRVWYFSFNQNESSQQSTRLKDWGLHSPNKKLGPDCNSASLGCGRWLSQDFHTIFFNAMVLNESGSV